MSNKRRLSLRISARDAVCYAEPDHALHDDDEEFLPKPKTESVAKRSRMHKNVRSVRIMPENRIKDATKSRCDVLYTRFEQCMAQMSTHKTSNAKHVLHWHSALSGLEQWLESTLMMVQAHAQVPDERVWAQSLLSNELRKCRELAESARNALEFRLGRLAQKLAPAKQKIAMRVGHPMVELLHDYGQRCIGYDAQGQCIYVRLFDIERKASSIRREFDALSKSLPLDCRRVPMAYMFLESQSQVGVCYELPRGGKFYTDYACQRESNDYARALCNGGEFFERLTAVSGGEGLLVDAVGQLWYVPVHSERFSARIAAPPRVHVPQIKAPDVVAFAQDSVARLVQSSSMVWDMLAHVAELSRKAPSPLTVEAFVYDNAPDSYGHGVTFAALSEFFEQLFFSHNLFRVAPNGMVLVASLEQQRSKCRGCCETHHDHAPDAACELLAPRNLRLVGRVLFQLLLRSKLESQHHFRVPYRFSSALCHALLHGCAPGLEKDIRQSVLWRELCDALSHSNDTVRALQSNTEDMCCDDDEGFVYGLDWSTVGLHDGSVKRSELDNFCASLTRHTLCDAMRYPHEIARHLSEGFCYHVKHRALLPRDANQLAEAICCPLRPLEYTAEQRAQFVDSICWINECDDDPALGELARETLRVKFLAFDSNQIRALCAYAGGTHSPLSRSPEQPLTFRLVSAKREGALSIHVCFNEIQLPCHGDIIHVFLKELCDTAIHCFNVE